MVRSSAKRAARAGNVAHRRRRAGVLAGPSRCSMLLEAKESAVNNADADKAFAGSIPKLYETFLVPLIFQPYAADLASRVASRSPSRVLELAAGTGVVTRQLASRLPDGVSIVATDLNQP